MGLLRRGLLAIVAGAAVVLGAPSPASAHGTLAMSNPANGATVTAPVGSVELFFTEKVPESATFAITAPDGGRVDNGWEHASPRPLDKPVTEYFIKNGKYEPRQYTTGFPARVRVAHLPATGEYRVDYRSTASDGDAVHGTVTFSYTGPLTPAPAGWAPPTGASSASAAAAVSSPAGGGTPWAWLGGGAAVLAVLAAGVLWWRRSPRPAVPVVPLAVGGVVVALIGGYALGRTTAPETRPTAYAGTGHQHGDGGAATVDALGTTVSSQGYTLQPERRSQAGSSQAGSSQAQVGSSQARAGSSQAQAGSSQAQAGSSQAPAGSSQAPAGPEYAFRIIGPDGQPVTRYAVVHDKPLHLVVVGRDLRGFQHLHPTMAPDGRWSVPLTLREPGAYRVFADFTVGATPLVLGVDHHVPGDARRAELPAPQAIVAAGPFLVSMEGSPTSGATVPVLFRVARSGAPGPAVLERYLGSYGHLVVLREGDLGYVHVHPDAELAAGAVRFNVSVPGAGRYRAFFEFQVAGKVHRAEFTLEAD
ncbi:copper resistance CopC family protein [Actinoplanes sp. URMC 104]|uniref:copper resistance CopC family protein n=1 Tax=Actinoplanes sp. URMC 104 TaxID=3423409 RepID=UPI003F1AB166